MRKRKQEKPSEPSGRQKERRKNIKKISNRAKYNIFIFVVIILYLVGLVHACFGVIIDACLYFTFASLLIVSEVDSLHEELHRQAERENKETEVNEHEENY